MNWYKKSQIRDVEIIERRENRNNYFDIGHKKDIGQEDVNYLWIFYNKEIISVEQTSDATTHDEVFFKKFPLSKLYTGRFESSTGKLSILKPYNGSAQFRDTPQELLYKLYQTFPSAKQIYKF